uniref:Transposase (Putative), gypsy type n=1 Tax=Tanacetum cinerariifolium TaxID=118510 RepID=A0A6L2KIQ9_TANCI|nr:hypothetical protein [Tanacetum cinerariifolium]
MQLKTKELHHTSAAPGTTGPKDRILDFPEGKPLLLGGRDGVPNCRGLAHKCSKRWDAGREYIFLIGRENTGHTPHPHPKTTRGATLLIGIKPQILPGGRDMDLFSLIRAPNPTKVKTGSRSRAAHEVPMLTVTASRVIEVEDPAAATDSSGVPSTIERSPLDFANEVGPEDQETMAPEVPLPEERCSRGRPSGKGCCHRSSCGSTRGGKSLGAIELGMGSTRPTHVPQSVPADVSDLDPMSFADPRSRPSADVAQSSKGAATIGDPESENTSFASIVGSPESIYRPEWVVPPYNDDFLRQYNVNLARQVAMGSQLRMRFEQEAKLLKKYVAQVARWDKRIQARENEIKNLEVLLEAEADMKKAAKDKSTKLSQELEDMWALFLDLQVSNDRLSQQVSTLQEKVSGDEKLKSAFEEFKQYEDNRVEQRCAEMDARLDALSIDFDEELHPHMLTAIAGRRWMIGRGLRLAMMKCGESIKLRQAFANVVSAGIAKGMSEGLKHGALKNLKYPLVDQLDGLKDALMNVIMAALHLESDTGDDALQWVRELRPSSSQLTIPMYSEVHERVFPTVVDWRTNAPKDGMPTESTYSVEAVRALDTHRTPHPKTIENATVRSRNKSQILSGGRDMDLFNLIRAPNPTKVKIRSRPSAPHEVPLLTLTANRVIEMDDPAAATDSSGVPSTIERSLLDFDHEAGASDQGTAAPEMPPSEDVPATVAPGAGQAEEVAAADPPAAVESRKRGNAHGGKSFVAIQLGLASAHLAPVPENAPAGVSDPDPLSFADPQSRNPADIAQSSQGTAAAGDPDSKNSYSPLAVGSPKSIYRPERYNVNLARQVAMGSQLRLRFEQEAKLLRKSVAQVARRDKRIQPRELEIKNLEALLEAETNTKKVAEDKSAGLSQELENMRARFSDLQVSNERLSQQVATLQQQVSREEKLKAAFEEFKRHQDDRVEQRCAEMEVRLDALSIDFDEELYPHMLTAIAGRRWVIGRGLRLTVMKCGESLELRQAFADVVSAGIAKGLSEGLRHGLEHGQAQLSLESIEAYDPKAEAKFVAALQALKDLKYPLVDQLEGLKDAPMDVIMAALYLESDTGDDATQEEMVLADAIAANISRAKKKKKCRIVCRTHGVGSVHHARSDGVPVSAPTMVPQGLALLLADAATQTELENDT